MKNVVFKKHQHPRCSNIFKWHKKSGTYALCLLTIQSTGMHAFLFLYLPVMFWFILHTLLLHVSHHFHAVRVKMVTNIQIIVCEINQNITHKAGFFLHKIKQVRAQKNAS